MFKKKPSLTKSAEQRLRKVAVKRVRAENVQRAVFLAEVRTTAPSEERQHEVGRLVRRVREAKSAGFLSQYRTIA